MSPVKFVHVMKRIESLDRDIAEIQMLQDDVNPQREYATALRISLEQQVNNLLNEKVKLMEVRIENAPEYLKAENRKKESEAKQSAALFSFDQLERQYHDALRHKRSNYGQEPVRIQENIATETILKSKKEKDMRQLPSLAEKTLVKASDSPAADEKSLLKKREDILKNLPPLEY